MPLAVPLALPALPPQQDPKLLALKPLKQIEQKIAKVLKTQGGKEYVYKSLKGGKGGDVNKARVYMNRELYDEEIAREHFQRQAGITRAGYGVVWWEDSPLVNQFETTGKGKNQNDARYLR